MQHSKLASPQDQTFDAELATYNLAFSELGLEWHWDAATSDHIRRAAGGRPCVLAYIESQCPHLLQAYDSGFLVDAVESVRCRKGDVRLA
jgi:hypothetical protein